MTRTQQLCETLVFCSKLRLYRKRKNFGETGPWSGDSGSFQNYVKITSINLTPFLFHQYKQNHVLLY